MADLVVVLGGKELATVFVGGYNRTQSFLGESFLWDIYGLKDVGGQTRNCLPAGNLPFWECQGRSGSFPDVQLGRVVVD